MNTELTHAIEPENTAPDPYALHQGNTSDDDGRAIDDYFEAPTLAPVEKGSVAYVKKEIAVPTRMIVRKLYVGTIGGVVYDPVMVFPADLNRKRLIITGVYDNNAFFSLGSEKSDAQTNGSIYQCIFGPLTIEGHTGALWVYSIASVAVDLTIISVTE